MKIRVELTLIKELEVDADHYGIGREHQLTIEEIQKQENETFDSDPFMYFDMMGSGRISHKLEVSEITGFNLAEV